MAHNAELIRSEMLAHDWNHQLENRNPYPVSLLRVKFMSLSRIEVPLAVTDMHGSSASGHFGTKLQMSKEVRKREKQNA